MIWQGQDRWSGHQCCALPTLDEQCQNSPGEENDNSNFYSFSQNSRLPSSKPNSIFGFVYLEATFEFKIFIVFKYQTFLHFHIRDMCCYENNNLKNNSTLLSFKDIFWHPCCHPQLKPTLNQQVNHVNLKLFVWISHNHAFFLSLLLYTFSFTILITIAYK